MTLLEMTLGGIPLHPLVVHAAVFLIPLAALLVIAYALRPGYRWALRGVTAVVNALALVVLFITRITGDDLAHATPDNKPLIEAHDHWAGLLTIATVPMTLLALFACWTLASVTPLPSGRGAVAARFEKLHPVLRGLLVLLALAVLFLVVMTGHSGAKAAWTN